MDEKRLPIDYLFRVRDDLDMILQRKPKAPDLIYDACEAALPHVCAAMGYLDSTPPNQNDRRNEQPLRNFEEMFKLPKERANDWRYKISEWLAGRSRNERIARDVLRLIRNDLREAKGLMILCDWRLMRLFGISARHWAVDSARPFGSRPRRTNLIRPFRQQLSIATASVPRVKVHVSR